MTIVESIKCVLQQNNDGLTSKQIYDEIIRQGLYSFGAENPVGVVNAQLRRRCIGLDFPTAYPIKFFEIAGYEGKKIKFRLISTENTATTITAPKTTDISELLPEEKIKAALQEHLQNIRQQVFDSVLNNSPEFFEHLVVDLLLKMGYGYDKNSGIVTGKPHDGGIDGIISEDKLGLDLIYIQAKRFANDLRLLKETVRNALNRAERREFFSDAQDSTSCLTALLHFKDTPNVEFSFDVAITTKNKNGNYMRLIHNKNVYALGLDQYTWNEVPNSHQVKDRADKLKRAGLWQKVRDRYLEKKNMYLFRQDHNHPSFVVYVEAVNEVYSRYFNRGGGYSVQSIF